MSDRLRTGVLMVVLFSVAALLSIGMFAGSLKTCRVVLLGSAELTPAQEENFREAFPDSMDGCDRLVESKSH